VTTHRPRRLRWRSTRGQVLSEYVVILGVLVLTIIAAMAMFVGPVAVAVVRLARRIMVNLTS
jgi:hypothetical protein